MTRWCETHGERPGKDTDGKDCRACDLLMLSDPRRWPHRTLLPLVRRAETGEPTHDIGVLTADPLGRPSRMRVIVGASVWGRLADRPPESYESPEALLAEWEID